MLICYNVGMDHFIGYDKETKAIVAEFEKLYGEGKKKAETVLRKLKKMGEERNDSKLLGYVYFYFANIYYDDSDYEKFQRNLREAIRHLLRSNDRELLSRSYNFFAIDAQINDAMDVAYSYYSSALQFVSEKDSPTAAGVVTQNLASFNYIIGDYLTARKYYRKGIKLIKKNKEDVFYNRNLLIANINDGINSIMMKDIASAKRALKKAKEILDKSGEELSKDAILSIDFLEVRIALEENDEKLIDEKTAFILDELKDETLSFIEMDDIVGLCNAYMAKGKCEVVKEMLSIIKPFISNNNITHVLRLLTEIEIEYYDKVGDEKNLVNALRRKHGIIIRQKEEQARIYQYSMDLIEVAGELREEEAQLKLENQHLRKQIVTDPLTKIPNRYAFDQELTMEFEKAYKRKRRFGISILDINGFKGFNDRYGHQVGDLCLEKVGEVLKSVGEEEGVFFARYGGDEFVVIYLDAKDDEIKRICERIREGIEGTEIIHRNKVIKENISVSQGACNDVPRDKTKLWDFLSQADEALYASKRTGEKETSVVRLPEFA